LTVLVSEERGQVSLFLKGAMRPLAHADELVAAIIRHWKETAAYPFVIPGGRARREMMSQMIASLALAVAFWTTLFISQGEQLEKMVTVPVEFTATPSDLLLVGDKDKEIRLHIAGSRSDLNALDPSLLRAKIDLTKAVAGKQTFVITSQNIRLPRGVELLDIVPSSIDLSLAALAEKDIPIKPQLVGKLPNGLKLQSAVVNPSTVKVLSPLDQNKPDNVMTTPIYLENLKEGAVIFCKIIAPPALHPVDKRWPDVEVTITVSR
jgi:YbbR domain-containing protein